MLETRILVCYPKRENTDSEWLNVSIPIDRAKFSKEIIETIKKSLEAPLTYKEKDEAYGDYTVVMENRLATLRGITGCTIKFLELDVAVANIDF